MSTQYLFLVVNLLGGCAVLGGYIVCLSAYPQHGEALWGGIQGDLRNVFIASMLLAASGYLVFCFYVIRLDGLSGEQSISLHLWATVTSSIFLLSAALWMPATISFIHLGHTVLWVVAVTSLWATAGSLVGLTAIFALNSELPTTLGRYIAILGIGYITFHCLVLDALIWVRLFDRHHL